MTKPGKVVKRPITSIHVVPFMRGLRWDIKVNRKKMGTFYRQIDAEMTAVFLAKLMTAASVRFHKANGEIKDERTYPRGAETPKPG